MKVTIETPEGFVFKAEDEDPLRIFQAIINLMRRFCPQYFPQRNK